MSLHILFREEIKYFTASFKHRLTWMCYNTFWSQRVGICDKGTTHFSHTLTEMCLVTFESQRVEIFRYKSSSQNDEDVYRWFSHIVTVTNVTELKLCNKSTANMVVVWASIGSVSFIFFASFWDKYTFIICSFIERLYLLLQETLQKIRPNS